MVDPVRENTRKIVAIMSGITGVCLIVMGLVLPLVVAIPTMLVGGILVVCGIVWVGV